MTCIVGIGNGINEVWLARDRAAVEDNHFLDISAHPKVFRRGPFIIGYTSSFRMGQLLQYRLEVMPPTDDLDAYMATTFVDAVRQLLKDGGYTKISDNQEKVGQFLVGIRGQIFTFDEDYNVRRSLSGYAAIGSGVSVALGSLHSTSQFDAASSMRLVMALEAASMFTTTVRGPFDIVSLGGKEI